MSKLTEVQEKLLETNVAMAELEKAIAKDASSISLQTMMASLNKRYRDLEADFLEEVESLGIDVCGYRVFGEEAHPTLKALSSVLGDFQNLVSVVYDAIKTAAPKERAKLSADVAAETEFRFGYAYPGSVGFVLTIPNQRRLIGESHLDESMRVISEMSKLQDSPDVLDYAKRLGPASVRALYKWAYDHATSGLGVDIEWRRREIIRTRLFAQRPELERLHQTISVTSEEREFEMTVYGDLVGADVLRQTFHIKLDTGEEIRGKLSEAITEEKTVELPIRYKACVTKTTKIYYSTEEEEVKYYLHSLEQL